MCSTTSCQVDCSSSNMDDDEGIWKLAPEEFMENETFEDASKNDEFVFRHRKIASGSEVSTEGEDDDDDFSFSLPSLDSAKEQAEQFVKKVWDWNVTHFKMLPEWLQDNDFVCSSYRPPLPSYKECFKSIFRLHNETGNIWSHMLGCIVFSFIAIYFVTRPDHEVQLQEKLVFSIFFRRRRGLFGFVVRFSYAVLSLGTGWTISPQIGLRWHHLSDHLFVYPLDILRVLLPS